MKTKEIQRITQEESCGDQLSGRGENILDGELDEPSQKDA